MYRTNATGLGQRGSAAMECLLALPFFLLIILLTYHLGAAFLVQLKSEAGARDAAWCYARTNPPRTVSGDEIDRGYNRGGRVSSIQWYDNPSQAQSSTGGQGGGSMQESGLLGGITSGGASDIYGCRMSYEYRVTSIEGMDKLPAGSIHFVARRNTWTYNELPGGHLGLIKQALGGFLGRFM